METSPPQKLQYWHHITLWRLPCVTFVYNTKTTWWAVREVTSRHEKQMVSQVRQTKRLEPGHHSPDHSTHQLQPSSSCRRWVITIELVNFQETVFRWFPLWHSLSYGIMDGGPAKLLIFTVANKVAGREHFQSCLSVSLSVHRRIDPPCRPKTFKLVHYEAYRTVGDLRLKDLPVSTV